MKTCKLTRAEKRFKRKCELLEGLPLRNCRNSYFKKKLKANPTKAELVVKEWFDKNLKGKAKVQFQKGFLVPFHRIVDFYVCRAKLIIEVDGGYHKDTVEKDKIKDEVFLKERGCKTLRITNEEVFDGSFEEKLICFLVKNYIDV